MSRLPCWLFVVVIAVGLAAGSSLKLDNNTPKEPQLFKDVCGECQQIVTRIVAVVKDPVKIQELKILLSALCHETSYEEECKMFVSRIDLFLDKLLPYMRNPHLFCSEIHLCSNTKIQQFHRVGMLFAKKYADKAKGASELICEECQFAAHELQNYVDDPTVQADVKTWISQNICSRMGSYRGDCDLVLDDFLPTVWQDLHDMLSDNKKFCVELELCDPTTVSSSRHQHQGLTVQVNGRDQRKVSERVMDIFLN